jgi:hypothetical protein
MIPALITWAAAALGAPAAQAAPHNGRCIQLDQVVRRIVLAPDLMEFETVGGRVLRNRLRAPCPGIEELDRFRTIQFDAQNGRRMCSGDRFRIVDQQLAAQGGSASARWCRFGAFELQRR